MAPVSAATASGGAASLTFAHTVNSGNNRILVVDVGVHQSGANEHVASITYGSAPPTAGKERIEVLAGSHQVIIDDFRSVLGNGRTLWKGRPDKGHRAHAAAFRQAVQGGPGLPTEAMLGSMRATIQAADRARAS